MSAYEPQYQQPPPQGGAYDNNAQYYNNQQPSYANGQTDAYGQPQQQPHADYNPQQPPVQPTPIDANAAGGAYVIPNDVNFGDQEKDTNKCNDPICSIFFVLQFIGMIALFGYYINRYVNGNITYWNYSLRTKPSVIAALFVSLALGGISGFFLTLLIRRFPGKALYVSFGAMLLFYAAFGAFLIAVGSVLAGILVLVFGVAFTALFLFCVRKRIKFSQRMVKYSIKAILSAWGIYIVAIANMIISGLYVVWWVIGSLSLISVEFQKHADAQGYDAANDAVGKWVGIWIGLVFPLFLTTETFQNIVHFVVCGVTAAFWFTPDERRVTIASLKRACIWSLGTVVFGSTITSLLRTARFAIRAFANDGSILAACAHCLLSCIENLVRFFNTYVFAWAATYGENYCASAKNTVDLISNKGFTIIINDELVSMLLTMSALACGGLTCGISGSFFYWVVMGEDDRNVSIFFFCFILGWVSSGVILQQIYSAVVATIVTWASAPDAMMANHNEYYQKLEKARKKFYS